MKKGFVIGTATDVSGIARYIIKKRMKAKSQLRSCNMDIPNLESMSRVNIVPMPRTIESVDPDDAGFEDYGFRRIFNIDKTVHRTVLITGAGSYIGESFKEYVAMHYPNIHCTVIDMIDGSWRNSSFMDNEGRPFDTVFHVAGVAHTDAGNTSVDAQEKYYTINTDLAIECAGKAKDAGIHQFIFMSSMIIYGDNEFVDEYTVPSPTNFYGNSKWLADKGVRALAADEFNIAVLRPPMIYGKESKGNYPILATLARVVPIFPAISNKKSILYIGNFCEFVAQLILSNQGGIYFPQNSDTISTDYLVREIGLATGHTIFTTKILNPAVKLARSMPIKKICDLTSKAFGNRYYDQKLSSYDGLDYQKFDFRTSILRTEIVEENRTEKNRILSEFLH